jgi:virulence-associated protein VagC
MKIPGLYKLSCRGQKLNVRPNKPAVRLPQDWTQLRERVVSIFQRHDGSIQKPAMESSAEYGVETQKLNVRPNKPAVRLPQDTKGKDYRGQVGRRGCE